MKKKDSSIPEEIVQRVLERYNWCCANCHKKVDLQLHHMLANSWEHRKLFPAFIDSEFNLVPLCAKCHTQNAWKYRLYPEDIYKLDKENYWTISEKDTQTSETDCNRENIYAAIDNYRKRNLEMGKEKLGKFRPPKGVQIIYRAEGYHGKSKRESKEQ